MKTALYRHDYKMNFNNIIETEFPHIDNYPDLELANADQCKVNDFLMNLYFIIRRISTDIKDQILN